MAIDGNWSITISTPMGDRTGSLVLATDGNALSGTLTNDFGDTPIHDGEVDGSHLFWCARVEQPMPMTLEFDMDLTDQGMTGVVMFGPLGEAPVVATRV